MPILENIHLVVIEMVFLILKQNSILRQAQGTLFDKARSLSLSKGNKPITNDYQ